jgi:hypothetical protein
MTSVSENSSFHGDTGTTHQMLTETYNNCPTEGDLKHSALQNIVINANIRAEIISRALNRQIGKVTLECEAPGGTVEDVSSKRLFGSVANNTVGSPQPFNSFGGNARLDACAAKLDLADGRSRTMQS